MGITLKLDTEHAEELAKNMDWRDLGQLQKFASKLRASIEAGNNEHVLHVPDEHIKRFTYLSNRLLPYGWTFQQKKNDEENDEIDDMW